MDINKIFSRNVLEKPDSKRASLVKSDLDFSRLIRMGWNENPYGMSPKALEASKKAAETAHLYQDFWCRELKKTIADFYQLETDNVCTGAGSSPLIETVGQAFLNPGDQVIMCPTFAAFLDMVGIRMAELIQVPLLEDKTYNLEGILDAITDRTKLIVVTNPNNPTGTYVGYDKIREFVKKVPDDVVILFDEAYMEFSTAADCRSAYPLIKEMPQKAIVVMKTFSKYYGMAGVRCGYLLAGSEIVEGLSKIPGGWVSSVAQAAAVAAMKDEAFYRESKKKIVEGIAYLQSALEAMGCRVYPTQANFIMFDPHCDPVYVKNVMLSKGIMINTPMYCRVSVGTMEENRYFISCMEEVLKKTA